MIQTKSGNIITYNPAEKFLIEMNFKDHRDIPVELAETIKHKLGDFNDRFWGHSQWEISGDGKRIRRIELKDRNVWGSRKVNWTKIKS
jgi:hypothetical protein